jgi:hypothetical protein
MRRSDRPAFLLAVLLTAGVSVWAAGLTVSTLTREGEVLVSLELSGAYTEDLRSAIQSGLQTSFMYDVRLSREEAFWPDSTVASATVSVTVKYDSLNQQYSLARMVDGRVEETVTANDESEIEALLTQFERIPLFATGDLEPNANYRVQVRVERRPRDGWFLLPWARAWASGAAQFTYLP